MARAPSVLIVQTNQQDGNKAQILWREVHRWGNCSVTQGGGTTSRCCHSRLSPLTWGGMNFAPRFDSSWFLPGCPSPGEQIISLWNARKITGVFCGDDPLANTKLGGQ